MYCTSTICCSYERIKLTRPLGFLISPKRLTINQCRFPINIFLVNTAMLIFSTLFSSPNYILFCYSIPEYILDEISKLARNFLLGRGGYKSSIHSLGRAITILASIALMTKNVISSFQFYEQNLG